MNSTSQVAAEYAAAIKDRVSAAEELLRHRIAIERYERELRVCEARLLLERAAEGKNAEERSARLLIRSAEDNTCQRLRALIEQERLSTGVADRLALQATEQCRLLRLRLALTVPAGIRALQE
jgi:hypothetical protein